MNTLEQKTLLLTFSLAIAGWVATGFAAIGVLYPIVSIVLLVPIFFCVSLLTDIMREQRAMWHGREWFGMVIGVLFLVTLVSHVGGVFLPETGFDALWYHLPAIRTYTQLHRLVHIPDLYQSLYPQLGDLLFALGFQVSGVFGAKFIAYLSMVSLLMVVYVWLRAHLTASWSMAGTLVVALLQVVGWQASSVYVDVMAALWFVTGCWVLLRVGSKKNTFRYSTPLSAFFFACFFATKFIALGFLPLIILLFLWSLHQSKVKVKWNVAVIIASVCIVMCSLFWYARAWWLTGNPVYPIGTPFAEPVIQQMEKGSWGEWLWYRAMIIYRLPMEFFFKNDGYVTPLLWLLPVVIGFNTFLDKIKATRLQSLKATQQEAFLTLQHCSFVAMSVYGLLFWWCFPPPSTRYVLGCVIVWWIGTFSFCIKWLEKQKEQRALLLTKVLVILTIIVFLGIRLYVNTRSIPYLLGKETEAEYLHRFRNGFLDEKIDRYYEL